MEPEVEPEILWRRREATFEKVSWEAVVKTTMKLKPELEDNPIEKGNIMNELFEIKIGDKTFYGYKLAMNSENKLVMELKGTGDVVVVAQDDVKEIMPYTITVTSFSGDAARSYTIESGKVAVNDLVLHQPKGSKTFGLGVVSAIDTKVKGAAQFTGSRLVSEIIV